MSINRLFKGLALGALAGWAVGALEAAMVGTLIPLSFPAPIHDSIVVARHFSLAGAVVGIIVAFLPERLRPNRTGSWLGLVFAALALISGLSWIHQEVFDAVPMYALGPLLASLGLTVGCGLAGYAFGSVPMPTLLAVMLAVTGHLGAGITAGQEESVQDVVRPEANDGVPNVLFLLVDTLRADHLGSYGYTKIETPHLDQLAARGVRFDSAWAQATWTRPSVASLMTSLYPASHRTNFLSVRVPEKLDTLAEIMQGAGYRTCGLSANRNVSEIFGFAQGFDYFWAYSSSELNSILRFTSWERVRIVFAKYLGIGRSKQGKEKSNAAALNVRALEWLDNNATGSSVPPWFLYIQYIDPHGPYAPPADFLQEKGIEVLPGEVLKQVGGINKEPPFPFGSQELVDPELLRRIVRLYDAEIEYTDREIGNLLATLKDKGMLDNTIVVLTSDHGEEFYEHKQFGHGQSTFSELSHIPLFIAGPGISSGVSSVPVELVDLYPTIATWAGAPVPQSIHGRDLSALLAGGDDRQRNSLVQNIKVGELHSLIVGRHKLVHVLSSSKQESWMLFDLDVDPGELNDISGDNPELMDKLREILASRRSESERYRVDETTEVVFDAATTQDLQGLGYLDDEEEE